MAPKSKRPASSDGTFMFVNEDFQSLFGGAKNSQVDRSKQSHVQRQSFAKRRRETRRKNASTTGSPTSVEGVSSPRLASGLSNAKEASEDDRATPNIEAPWILGSGEPESDASQTSLPYWNRPIDPSIWQPGNSDWTSEQLADRTHSEVTQLNVPANTQHMISPALFEGSTSATSPAFEQFARTNDHTYTTTPASDPFNDMQVALELWVPPLMKYYTTNIIPEFFSIDLQAAPLRDMRHVEDLHEDMRSCMANPSEMYALLAASAYYAHSKDGNLSLPCVGPGDSDRVKLLLKSKAFEALRKRLSTGVITHGTVMAIQRLITSAIYTNSFTAVEAHYRAAVSMVEQVGGLDSFNDFQKEQLIMHDLYFAVSSDNHPRFKMRDPGVYVGDSGYHNYRSIREKEGFLPGWQILPALTASGVAINNNVAEAIPQLAETQLLHQWLSTQAYRPHDYRWLTQKRLAIAHMILTTVLPLVQDETLSFGDKDIVHLALISYLILTRTIPFVPLTKPCGGILESLRGWHADTLLSSFERDRSVLLWIVTLFYCTVPLSELESAEQSQNEDQDKLSMLVHVARVICQERCILNEGQLRSILITCLFDEQLLTAQYNRWTSELLLERS